VSFGVDFNQHDRPSQCAICRGRGRLTPDSTACVVGSDPARFPKSGITETACPTGQPSAGCLQRAAYPVFVPKTDADGRDLAGVRLPTLEVPAATHTGWNLRKAGFGQGELCDNNGTMIPFAATREERLKNGDPRPSMAERYPNDGDRAPALAKAAQQLVRDRLLLEEDAKLFVPNVN